LIEKIWGLFAYLSIHEDLPEILHLPAFTDEEFLELQVLAIDLGGVSNLVSFKETSVFMNNLYLTLFFNFIISNVIIIKKNATKKRINTKKATTTLRMSIFDKRD
jgi:hypothetical protein